MTPDLRLSTDWPDHRKTRGLVRLVGEIGPRCLLRLWAYAANRKPDGDLSGMSDSEIADSAGWPESEPVERFIDALRELHWIDGEPGAFVLHDWLEHQPWIAERAARREKARELAFRSWEKRRASGTNAARNAQRNAARIENGCGAQCSQPNPTQPNPDQGANAPLSNPPVGDDSTGAGSQSPEPVETPKAPEREPRDTPTRRIFDHWRETMKHPGARLDEKRTRAIRHALQLGYTEERIRQAITGCSLTPHNMGDNDRGQRYDGLELILRNADQIDRFIGNATNPPKPKPRSASGRRHDPDDQTRDRYGVKYGSIILAEELGLIPGGANDGQS